MRIRPGTSFIAVATILLTLVQLGILCRLFYWVIGAFYISGLLLNCCHRLWHYEGMIDDEATGELPANIKDDIVKRIRQGVILKLGDNDSFADFGIDDPRPVDVCNVCLVNYEHGDRVVTSSCNHVFHQDCILEWLARCHDCPCCRQSYVDPEAGVVVPVLALFGVKDAISSEPK